MKKWLKVPVILSAALGAIPAIAALVKTTFIRIHVMHTLVEVSSKVFIDGTTLGFKPGPDYVYISGWRPVVDRLLILAIVLAAIWLVTGIVLGVRRLRGRGIAAT